MPSRYRGRLKTRVSLPARPGDTNPEARNAIAGIVCEITALSDAAAHHGLPPADVAELHRWMHAHPDHPAARFIWAMLRAHVPGATCDPEPPPTQKQRRDRALAKHVAQGLADGTWETERRAVAAIYAHWTLKRELGVAALSEPGIRAALIRGKHLLDRN